MKVNSFRLKIENASYCVAILSLWFLYQKGFNRLFGAIITVVTSQSMF